MANHMKDVAKMLGVKLGEKFVITGGVVCGSDEKAPMYYFDESGLKCDETEDWLCGLFLNHLLSGEYTIKRQPWRPHVNEQYWYTDGYHVFNDYWQGYVRHWNAYKIGNCYQTKEAAEADREKWIKFYESDTVLGGDRQ